MKQEFQDHLNFHLKMIAAFWGNQDGFISFGSFSAGLPDARKTW
jgi:hypothetical protein